MGEFLDFKIARDELSERLGGGLPRGSLIVVEAPYGAGKSIFTQRILYGLLENHHTVGVVSTELTTLGFIAQMRSLDYTVERHLLSRDLLFLPVYPLVGHRQLPHDLLARLRGAKRLYEKDVIVIDTYSKLVADQARVLAQRPLVGATSDGPVTLSPTEAAGEVEKEAEETLYHMKRMAAVGRTIILTIEPGRMPERLLHLYRDASDVHFGMEFSLVGNAAARRIVVNRFSRAKNRFGDVIGYRVEPTVGLVIEIKSVA